MANTRSKNVINVDTTATLSEVIAIEGILYVGTSASSSVVITDSVSTSPMWEASGTTRSFDDVCIYGTSGITVTCANGGEVYLYQK